MNAERLKALRERADQAVKVVAEIEVVQSAEPFKWSGPYKLDVALQQRIIKAGIAAVLADLERQLESLLVPEPPEPVEKPPEMEPCCECGSDYPRAELLAGEIYCSTCRQIEAKRLARRASGFRLGEAKPQVTFPPAVIVDAGPPTVPLHS